MKSISNSKSEKCSFIIVTYNSSNDILECVYSIKKYHPECGLYIIDNNSTDGTQDLIASLNKVKTTLLPVNSGYAGGNNLGIKQAIADGYEYFLLFNPDARLNSKIVNSLIYLSSSKRCLAGPIIKDFYTGKIQSNGGTYNPLFSHFKVSESAPIRGIDYKLVDWILGAALLISKEIILKCGYLDENFFPACLEESCYCNEARKKGILSYIDNKSEIVHIGGTSSGGDQKYLLRLIKNRYYYALNYQNIFFFTTTVIESTLRYIYHKLFGILKKYPK
tara:strand:- start:2409 stop:3239 length:831 start_codon:yes stop_codon:yes gene_type:complete